MTTGLLSTHDAVGCDCVRVRIQHDNHHAFEEARHNSARLFSEDRNRLSAILLANACKLKLLSDPEILSEI